MARKQPRLHCGVVVIAPLFKEKHRGAPAVRLDTDSNVSVCPKLLVEQKDQLQRRYSEAKRQMQEYGIIKQNVDGILRTTPGKEQMQER